MQQQVLSRRRFFARTTTGSALLGASALVARRAYGANERLSIGLIGVGDRGGAHMAEIHRLAEKMNVEITALCDVWKVNLNRAAARVKGWWGKEPRQFSRFGDLLALKDVDAVVIATPDHLHTPIMIAALKAGKDVYVEKPMSMDVAEANEALDLARAGNRIVQAGTQYRSDGGYIAAAKTLATGVLGKINRISASGNFNEGRWNRKFADCKEADVDWDAYLLNRPKRSFDPSLLRRWHFYRDFTNGLSGLWMSHYVDAVHILTGAKYPASAVSLGGIYVWNDGREHTDTFHTIMEYPEGFLWDWGMSLGNGAGNFFRVHGTLGTLEVSTGHAEPNSLTLSPEGGSNDTKIEKSRIKPEPGQSHMGNWLECIRSRQQPNADIQFGHQHAIATIMAATALETGRRQKWDPKKREIYAG
jgi:predicted dehydrogenase